MFWIFAGVLMVVAVAAAAWPFLRPRKAAIDDSAFSMEIYRDQLAEIDRDVARGLIGETEAENIRAEVGRRLIREADSVEKGTVNDTRPAARGAFMLASILAVFLMAGGFGTYFWLGEPDFSGRQAAQIAKVEGQHPDMIRMVESLEARLADGEGTAQDYALLARSYMVLERRREAVEAYRRAMALGGGADINLLGEFAETLVIANGGTVVPEARDIFNDVLMQRPDDARARHFAAVAAAQAGDVEGALARWQALGRDSDPRAGYMQVVNQMIRNAAANLGIDPDEALAAARPSGARDPVMAASGGDSQRTGASGLGNPTAADVQNAMAMTPQDRAAMIEGMVAGLEARMEQEPDFIDGWLRLARSYGVLGRKEDAVTAWLRAAELAPGRPDIMTGLQQARAALGGDAAPARPTAQVAGGYGAIEGLSETSRTPEINDAGTEMPATRGPSAEEVAAAMQMAPEDRQAMVSGMVAGLEKRLRTSEPDNLEGWMQLGRSHLVMGNFADALEAWDRARQLAPTNTRAQAGYAEALIKSSEGRALPREAVAALEKVLAYDPLHPQALWFVGLDAVENGDPDTARALWNRLRGGLDPASDDYAFITRSIDMLGGNEGDADGREQNAGRPGQ